MNIEFEYLYRDAGNFKRFGSVVFANKYALSPKEIERRVLSSIGIDQNFVAKEFDVLNLFFPDFPFDPELDHGLHEFSEISETDKPADGGTQRDISDFLSGMEARPFKDFAPPIR